MSFSKTTRKVASTITPVKVIGDRRNSEEIAKTVKTTLNSAWTPNKGPLNTQLFEERKTLIGHWFEHWTDSQRRQFLEHLVAKFNKMSVHYIHDKIKDRIPKPPQDFTRIFPQYISFKIFSYLDPRTLSQASLTCWHWKWLAEHDTVWKPKCVRKGWIRDGPEPPYERAVWKRFYQQSVWDLLHPPPPPLNLHNSLCEEPEEDALSVADSVSSDTEIGETMEDGGLNTSAESNCSSKRTSGGSSKRGKPKTYKLGDVTPRTVGYLKHKQQELPPWRSSDSKPKDIQLFNKAILGLNCEAGVPKHITDQFTRVDRTTRTPTRSSPSPRSPIPRTKSMDMGNGAETPTKERHSTPNSSPLKSKSTVIERNPSSPSLLSSKSQVVDSKSSPQRKHSTPNLTRKPGNQSPMPRKNNGIVAKSTPKASRKVKKTESTDRVDAQPFPQAWVTSPEPRDTTARKVASTDTLGSDAGLDQESNDSLSIYGDDSGKLSGEAWELSSNISDI